MNSIELTEKLVSFPSFVDGKNNERSVSDFLLDFTKEKLTWMESVIQEVSPGRINILIKDRYPTRLLVVDHVDTVIPGDDWQSDPLVAHKKNGKLFGLGTSDSKGNIAAFLTALQTFGRTKGLAMLFYVDEEYAFKGMKKFINSDIAASINPKVIVSIDGSSSALGIGCRGLVDFIVRIKSPSGHSANPKNCGSIMPLLETYKAFREWLNKRQGSKLPIASAQMASVKAGLKIGGDFKHPIFADTGNQIPNFAEARIEVRTDIGTELQDIKKFWQNALKDFVGISYSFDLLLDYPGYSTTIEDAKEIVDAINTELGSTPTLDISKFGYLDMAMLRQKYPNALLCSFGLGAQDAAHKANEYIDINALEKGESVYLRILKTLVK
ncbi:MAG: M20 family metallopeptidase [Patescibacteria group bacterium]|jgi:acetylornithine deacetylase/succinyl-diaminopimelate desuccinylase-like protein